MPILDPSIGRNVRHRKHHRHLSEINAGLLGGSVGNVLTRIGSGDYDYAFQTIVGSEVAVSIAMLEQVSKWNSGVDTGGSGMAWDPIHPNLLHHLADDNTEGESDLYAYWVTEVDDPANPTSETVIFRATLANQNDLEALSLIQMSGTWYLAVFENTGDIVRIYERPNLEPGQTLVTQTPIAGSNWSWTPSAGLDNTENGTESMRWNPWDGRLYFLTPRGINTSLSDTERSLWRSADWRSATPTSLPSTTITEVGEVVTRPNNASDVPNANGDIEFLGEHVLLIAGTGTNGSVYNNYIMAVTKDTDQDWTDVIPVSGGPNFPAVLTQTGTTGGHESIAANRATGVVWACSENTTLDANVFKVQLTEGPRIYPAGAGGTTDTIAQTYRLSSIIAPRTDIDQTATLQSHMDNVAKEGDSYLVDNVFRIDGPLNTKQTHPFVGFSHPGFGVSGNDNWTADPTTFSVFPCGFVGKGNSTMFVIDTDSVTGNPDFRGMLMRDIGFSDVSAGGNQVINFIKVLDRIGTRFENILFDQHENVTSTGAAAVRLQSIDTANYDSQYGVFEGCRWNDCIRQVWIGGPTINQPTGHKEAPDYYFSNCVMWTKDNASTPVTGSYGFLLQTGSCYISNTDINFADNGIIYDAADNSFGANYNGLSNVRIEANQNWTDNAGDAAIKVINQARFNKGVAVHFANHGKYANIFEFEAGTEANEFDCSLADFNTQINVVDNGDDNIVLTPLHHLHSISGTYDLDDKLALHQKYGRVIRMSADTVLLPSAARTTQGGVMLKISNLSASAGTITPKAGQTINALSAGTSFSLPAYTTVECVSNGASAWVVN